MRIDSFTASPDLVGRRVRLRWVFVAEPGETVPDAPPVTVRRKRRDFEFPPVTGADPYLLFDSAAFPPAPVPGALVVHDLPDTDRIEGAQRIREQTVTVAELVAGKPREVLRQTVRTVFAADRAVLRREVELLDVGGAGAVLEPGVPYYYRLDSPSLEHPDRFRITATPGEVFGHNRTLYELVPEVYRRHDTIARLPDDGTGLLPEASAGGGQLRRFTDVFGAALDSIRSSAEALRSLRDVSEVDHSFLPLLAQWVGWDLTADRDIARQRNEIRTAPRLYDAVGTLPGLRSIVDHYTGWSTRVTEFAQHVTRANVVPQRNVFAAVRKSGGWWGADEAAAVLGFTSPNDHAVGADGVAAQLTGAAAEPFALRPGMTVTIAVDGRLPVTITFGRADFADLGAATAGEVADVVNRTTGEPLAEPVAGVLRLRSRLAGLDSRVEFVSSPASLISLDGAPDGRLSTAADTEGRVWLAHATTVGAGGVLPRLHVKTYLRGTWYDTRQVDEQPVAPAADPAVVSQSDGRLWLAWVEHPGTDRARLRWRRGVPRPLTPARLRGDVVAPFRLTADTRMVLTGFGGTETFTVRPADYANLDAATADEVAAAINGQLSGVTATAAVDGSLALHSTATGPGVTLRVRLASSTSARALGFGDRQLTGRGGWEPGADWARGQNVGPVPAGRHADCTAAVDPEGAVRLCWSAHVAGAWRIARTRWDGRLSVATSAGVGVLSDDGTWRTATTANGLPSNDVRGVAVDADGTTWYATGTGAAVRRPNGAITVLPGGPADNDVRAVATAPDGTVWFATAAGASARSADGVWRTVTTADGLAHNDVRHVAVTLDGTVWFATAAGISSLGREGGWRTLTVAHGLPGNDVRQIAQAQDGVLWVATGAGAATVSATGSVTAVDLSGLGVAANDVRAVAPAPPPSTPDTRQTAVGAVWLATAQGVVELRSVRDLRLHSTANGLPGDDCRAVLVAPDGVVWAGTSAGLGRRGVTGEWRQVTTADGLAGNGVRGLHGPWSAPQWFAGSDAGERDPHLVRDGNRMWLAHAQRKAVGDPADTWLIRLRRFDFPGPAWSAPVTVTKTTGRATDREPALTPLPSGAARLYFRSDRGGGRRLWSVDVDAGDVATAPATVTATAASDGNPTLVAMPEGTPWLLFRSDRNVALGRLGGGVPSTAEADVSRRAPEEASIRRYAGSITAFVGDLDRNRGQRQFGDLLDYTPQQPGGGRLAPDELYTPGTIGLYVERGPAGRPLVRRDADRLRQLLERFLPVNLRAVIVLRSGELEEVVFPPGHELSDAYRDDFPFAETVRGVVDSTSVVLPGWLVFLSTDGTSLTVDPTRPTTLRRRSWWPPFQ